MGLSGIWPNAMKQDRRRQEGDDLVEEDRIGMRYLHLQKKETEGEKYDQQV